MSAVEDFPLPPDLAVDEAPLDDFAIGIIRSFEGDWSDPGQVSIEGRAVLGFRIEDDDTAEWAGRHLTTEDAAVARLRAQADEYVSKIEHWFEQASAGHRRFSTKLDGWLRDYALRIREASGGEIKSVDLPSVRVATRATGGKAEVEIEEAVARWAETVPVEVLRGRLVVEPLADTPSTPEELRAMLVVRKPKVYVGPLRKLTTVVDVPVGVEVAIEADCGHSWSFLAPPDDEEMIAVDAQVSGPPAGISVACPSCAFDQIDRAARMVKVVASSARVATEKQVRDLSGEPVPGTSVAPVVIEATVTARG